MLRSKHIYKSVGIFLVMMVLVTMANSLAAARVGHASPGPVIAETVCQVLPSVPSIPVKDDFKPPKHSFVDYDIFFSCAAFRPVSRPFATFPAPDSGRKALSGALPEILIPPKI